MCEGAAGICIGTHALVGSPFLQCEVLLKRLMSALFAGVQYMYMLESALPNLTSAPQLDMLQMKQSVTLRRPPWPRLLCRPDKQGLYLPNTFRRSSMRKCSSTGTQQPGEPHSNHVIFPWSKRKCNGTFSEGCHCSERTTRPLRRHHAAVNRRSISFVLWWGFAKMAGCPTLSPVRWLAEDMMTIRG